MLIEIRQYNVIEEYHSAILFLNTIIHDPENDSTYIPSAIHITDRIISGGVVSVCSSPPFVSFAALF